MGCAHQCTFCYVRAFERIADRPSDSRYGASIRVKTNLVGVLRRELGRRSWLREEVAIGTATDPYQPAEGRFRLTRGAIAALGDARTPFYVITRGPMIVRDVDVLSAAAQRAKVGVTFSIPTLDQRIWRLTEPGTAPPEQRLRAVRTLVDAGIDASVGMAPILPGLSDDPGLMADVVRAARAAGATSIWTNVLHLKPGTREHFLENLARDWPELLPKYRALYAGRAYVANDVIAPVRRRVAALAAQYEIADRRIDPVVPGPDPIAEQLPLTAFLQAPGLDPSVMNTGQALPRTRTAVFSPTDARDGHLVPQNSSPIRSRSSTPNTSRYRTLRGSSLSGSPK
jgi:DNA repair photolyase